MYETWFRFTRRPFTTAPQLSDYFGASAVEAAARAISRCVNRGSGPSLAIGPTGTGKTVLCMKLHASFCSRIPTAHVCCSGLGDRRSFLQSILFEFGRPFRQLDDGELRLSLVDYLTSRDATQSGALLLLDDAHALPDDALDEIRMLSNLVRNGRWCAHLVLTGVASLEECLHTPQMESFQQRLTARCYLEPFRREETTGYIRQCLQRSNGHLEAVFSPEALQRLHDHTKGVPRLINQLCDHALLLASIGHHHQLDAAGIDEAWSDLQQLPSPQWESPTANAADVIEFGLLDGEESPPPTEMTQLETETSGAVEFDAEPAFETPLVETPSGSDDDDPERGIPIVPPHFPLSGGSVPDDLWTGDSPDLFDDNEVPSSEYANGGNSAEFRPIESQIIDEPMSASDKRLAEIEEKLASLSDELAYAPQDWSAADASSEVDAPTLCENPFLDEFESEELVIDRMGSLCHALIKRQPQVAAPDSAELLSQLGSVTLAESPETASAVIGQREQLVDDGAVDDVDALPVSLAEREEEIGDSDCVLLDDSDPDELAVAVIELEEELLTEEETGEGLELGDVELNLADPLEVATDLAQGARSPWPDGEFALQVRPSEEASESGRFIPLVTWGRNYEIPIVLPQTAEELFEDESVVEDEAAVAGEDPADEPETAAALSPIAHDTCHEPENEIAPPSPSRAPEKRRFGKLFANLQSH